MGLWLRSRVWLRSSDVGQFFMSFAYWEAAANVLTGSALDPVAKIPGFKVTAAELRHLVTS